MTESEIIDAAIAGDQAACTELYEVHRGRVFNTLLQMTKNREDAEDLLQMAFIAAFKSLSKFNRESKFSTWLHRIAVNYFLMKLRSGKKESLTDSLDEPIDDDDDRSFTETIGTRDEVLESFADRDTIMRCVAQLPPGQKQIVSLMAQGYGHEEIAAILGCTEGNSKSQLHKAKLKLRNLIVSNEPKPRAESMLAFERPVPKLAVAVTSIECQPVRFNLPANAKLAAKILGCSIDAIYGRLWRGWSVEAAFTRPARPQKCYPAARLTPAELSQMYWGEPRKSTHQIAQELRVQHGSITYRLRKFGIPVRPMHSGKVTPIRIDVDACRKMYEKGMVLKEIGARLNVHWEMVRKYLRRAGVTMKPRHARIREHCKHPGCTEPIHKKWHAVHKKFLGTECLAHRREHYALLSRRYQRRIKDIKPEDYNLSRIKYQDPLEVPLVSSTFSA